MPSPPRHLAIALLLVAGSAGAADVVVIRDLRLGFGMLQGGVSSDGDSTRQSVVASAGADRDSDSHTRIGLSFVGAYALPGEGGLLAGLGLASDTASSTGYSPAWGEDIAQDWSGYILTNQIGWAYAFDERLHIEAAVIGGFGLGTVEISGVTGYTFDPGDALILEYGLRLGGYVTLRQAQLGVELGYQTTRYQSSEWVLAGSPETIYAEDSVFSGLFFGLTLGYRL